MYAGGVRRSGAGATLLGAGHRVAPHEVGGVGAMGHGSVLCVRRPRVAVLATGAELVPLGAAARPSQVHDSSRHGIAAQATAAGGAVVASTSVGDDIEATVEALAAMLDGTGDRRPDVVVTNGGISVGVHDVVRPALARLGVEELIRGVRVAPVWPPTSDGAATRSSWACPATRPRRPWPSTCWADPSWGRTTIGGGGRRSPSRSPAAPAAPSSCAASRVPTG